tara:strand:- start:3098 stop:4828 length:1731 start_codon:yes stop_codon:yes gene_type:complete
MAKIKIDRRKYYRESLRLYAKLSGNFTRTLDKLFISQRKLAVRRYAKYEMIGDSFYFGLATKLHKAFDKNAKQVFENSTQMTQRMREIKATDKEDLELYNPVIAENVTQVTQTTKIMIERSIVSSLNDGLGTEDTAKRLAESSAFSRQRSRVIARTETHQAMNYANNTIAKRMNLKKPVKKWASALDERTRGWHREMNSKPAIGIDEMFMVLTPTAGGAITERFMSYTGDPAGGASNVIQCRCFTLYYDQDDDVIEGATTVKKPKKLRKPRVKPLIIPPAKINETSLANPIQTSAIVVNKTKKELKEDIKALSTEGTKTPDKYLRSQYRGSKNRGEVYYDNWNEEELTKISILLKEANDLADLHKLPRLQGTMGVGRSRANAMMGDGILYFNKNVFGLNRRVSITSRMEKEIDFKLGKTKLEQEVIGKKFPVTTKASMKNSDNQMWSVKEYYFKERKITSKTKITDDLRKDILFQGNRSTVYHEMGHHIHQQLRYSAGSTDNIESLLGSYFAKASRKDKILLKETNTTKLFPSQYSTTNSKEWFAENFSLYHQKGLRKYCSEDFIEFYEKEVLTRI